MEEISSIDIDKTYEELSRLIAKYNLRSQTGESKLKEFSEAKNQYLIPKKRSLYLIMPPKIGLVMTIGKMVMVTLETLTLTSSYLLNHAILV